MSESDIKQRCERTRAHLARLREQLFDRLLELECLELHTCADIEASYLAQIGSYECDLFVSENRVARIKRKVHLVQQSLDKGIWPDFHQVEWQVSNEYQAHDELLANQRHGVEVAVRHCAALEAQSIDTRMEIENLHATALRRLHPDLNPQLPDEYRALFEQAREAYRSDNLEQLRAIEHTTRDVPCDTGWDAETSLDELLDQVSLTELQISFTQNVINQIKHSFPYTQKTLVDDPEQVASNIHDIKQLIADYDEEYSWYAIELTALLDNLE